MARTSRAAALVGVFVVLDDDLIGDVTRLTGYVHRVFVASTTTCRRRQRAADLAESGCRHTSGKQKRKHKGQ
jgi:hypothetical protein